MLGVSSRSWSERRFILSTPGNNFPRVCLWTPGLSVWREPFWTTFCKRRPRCFTSSWCHLHPTNAQRQGITRRSLDAMETTQREKPPALGEKKKSSSTLSQADELSPEPPSLLRKVSRLSSSDEKRPPRQSLSWIDDKGGGLVEVHYREELHYSLHSRDKEVVRRQQLRNGCIVDDPPPEPNLHRRGCCILS